MLHACRWLLAVKKYERGLKMVETMDKASPEQERAVGDLRRSCNLNLAAAYLKLDNPVAAQKAASVVNSHWPAGLAVTSTRLPCAIVS